MLGQFFSHSTHPIMLRAGLSLLLAWGSMIVRGLFLIYILVVIKTNEIQIHKVPIFTRYDAHIQMTHFLDLNNAKLLMSLVSIFFQKFIFNAK